ncbi:uncharacterized protein LOC117190472 [Drosophila miranda]|uniref:uncharacterized protein LOC117190472 n=1 Tax=Drosophila miranda TaxID=7229 RepID=UPI00143F5C85|nr:uncharacterized protein LOC117190472 [Drosophila miranda]
MRMLLALFLALLGTSNVYGNDDCNEDCKLSRYQRALENGLAVYSAQHNYQLPVSPKINSRTFSANSVRKISNLVCGFATLLNPKWNCTDKDETQEEDEASRPSIRWPEYHPSPTLPPYQPPYLPPNELLPTCTGDQPSGPCGSEIPEKTIVITIDKSELLTMAKELLQALKRKGSSDRDSAKYTRLQGQLEAVIPQAVNDGVQESRIDPDDLVERLNAHCGPLGCISKCEVDGKCILVKRIGGDYYGQ